MLLSLRGLSGNNLLLHDETIGRMYSFVVPHQFIGHDKAEAVVESQRLVVTLLHVEIYGTNVSAMRRGLHKAEYMVDELGPNSHFAIRSQYSESHNVKFRGRIARGDVRGRRG